MKHQTESVCPVCLDRIPAQRVEREGNIYLEKTCPKHGSFHTLIWEGTPDYWDWAAEERKPTRPLTEDGVRLGCPFDCGLCGQHRQRTCCVLLEVTARCNLRCPVCFADAGSPQDDPGLDVIGRWYDRIREQAGRANIQLSGGEPTVRDDLPEIIRMGKEKGFTYFQLNTNGLRLAQEPDYAQQLKDAGLSCVFLQFDGVSDDVYVALRGRALLAEKLQAIENCARARLGVVLVPVVQYGVNVHQIGAILDFAMERLPVVHGVHFQPLTYFGRYPGQENERLTLPRLLREIEAQTNGRLRVKDFSGGSAEHSHCSFSGNFVLDGDQIVRSLKIKRSNSKNNSSSCCCSTPTKRGVTLVEQVRDTVANRWGAAVPEHEAPPKDPDSLEGMAYRLRHKRFSVSAMAFQDCWSLDLERLKNCYIHVVAPDGQLIPFCAYNLTSADGQPLYRTKERLDKV